MILALIGATAAVSGVVLASRKRRHLGRMLTPSTPAHRNGQAPSSHLPSTMAAPPSLLKPRVPWLAKHPLGQLLSLSDLKRSRLIVAGLVSAAAVLVSLLPLLLLASVYKVIVMGRSALLVKLGLVSLRAQLAFLGAALLGSQGLEALMEHTQRKTWLQIARDLEHQLRVQGVSRVQHFDLAYLENQRSGQVLHIISADTDQVHQFFQSGLHHWLQASVTLLALGIVLLSLSPLLTLLALLPPTLVIVLERRLQRRGATLYGELREKTDELQHLLTNNLSGLSTVKSFTAENFEVDRIERASEMARQTTSQVSTHHSLSASLIRCLTMGSFVLTIILAGGLVVGGGLSLGAFIFIASCIGYFQAQTKNVEMSYDLYQRAMASAERILNLLETPISIQSGPRGLPAATIRGEIAFDQVGFAYDPGVDILDGFSLHLKAGETLALVGATGCGKTTLVKLLLRFYDVDSGAIRLDGIDIRDLDLLDLRQAMGLISQDVYLFHGTVYDNIAYGRRGACEAEVMAAARVAEAHDFIEQLPQGYKTIIGERGQKLSGGQRQRLAIARAVLKNPPILLLDEATSALDNETEASIQHSLDALCVHRTVIMIAHRLSTVRHADRICVMGGGRILEAGDHDELLDLEGMYADLVRVSAG